MNRSIPVLAPLLVCILLAASCHAPGSQSPQPVADPSSIVPISEEAAASFERKASQLAGQSTRIEFTEQEFTSYLALRLGDTVPMTNPQVRFRPAHFRFEGDLTAPLRAHIALTGTASAVGGHLQLTFESASIGRLSLPRPLLASLSDSLLDTVGVDDERFALDSVTIEQGCITIIGSGQP